MNTARLEFISSKQLSERSSIVIYTYSFVIYSNLKQLVV
jgi:hypothetical protein